MASQHFKIPHLSTKWAQSRRNMNEKEKNVHCSSSPTRPVLNWKE
jgi:hypothetical protein